MVKQTNHINLFLTCHIELQIISPAWTDELELPDGLYSVSDVPDYIEYIIKRTKNCLPILLFIFTSIELIIDYFSK